jgi:hypothetical protein
MLPNYDQASLDFRNSTAFNVPKNPEQTVNQNTKNNAGPYKSSNVVADSISPSKDVPTKPKSPIYAVLEEASPDESNTEGHKEPPMAAEPVYAVLEPPENNDLIVPENNSENVESNEQITGNVDEEKKTDPLDTIPEVKYATKNQDNICFDSVKPTAEGLVDAQKDPESISNSPIYNILEPQLPEVPERDESLEIKDKENDTKLSAECTDTPESTYMPLIPPKERQSPSGKTEDPTDYQLLSPKPRERLTSRTVSMIFIIS